MRPHVAGSSETRGLNRHRGAVARVEPPRGTNRAATMRLLSGGPDVHDAVTMPRALDTISGQGREPGGDSVCSAPMEPWGATRRARTAGFHSGSRAWGERTHATVA